VLCSPCGELYPLLKSDNLAKAFPLTLKYAWSRANLTMLWRTENEGMDFAAHNVTSPPLYPAQTANSPRGGDIAKLMIATCLDREFSATTDAILHPLRCKWLAVNPASCIRLPRYDMCLLKLIAEDPARRKVVGIKHLAGVVIAPMLCNTCHLSASSISP